MASRVLPGTFPHKATNKLSAKTRLLREKVKETTAARVKETQREKARGNEGHAITVGVMGTDGRTVRRAKERGMGNNSGVSIPCVVYRK